MIFKDAGYMDELMATEWSDHISSKSLKKQSQLKMAKMPNVPTSDDVRKLTEGFAKEVEIASNMLLSKVDPKCWRNLTEALLSQVETFNKRPAGEASRLKITDFKMGKDKVGLKVQEEFLKALKENELCLE
jgi:hypothetical protein